MYSKTSVIQAVQDQRVSVTLKSSPCSISKLLHFLRLSDCMHLLWMSGWNWLSSQTVSVHVHVHVHRTQQHSYQSIEDESICKFGKPLDGVLELDACNLHQLHALLHAGQAVVGGGQGVQWVRLVRCSVHCLGQIFYHCIQVGHILSLKTHL